MAGRRDPATAQMLMIENRAEGEQQGGGGGKDPVTAHMLITIQYKDLLGCCHASLLPVSNPPKKPYIPCCAANVCMQCSKVTHRLVGDSIASRLLLGQHIAVYIVSCILYSYPGQLLVSERMLLNLASENAYTDSLSRLALTACHVQVHATCIETIGLVLAANAQRLVILLICVASKVWQYPGL